ncbi:MAG: hypothetical protein ACJA0S_001247 [Rickettsiales bacterium]|jgi:hypothetical protein
MNKSLETYQQQKADFLDNLSPDDLINGENFNLVEEIIERINQAYFQHYLRQDNHQEFIQKAFGNLFRQNSLITIKAINLAEIYLEEIGKDK